jgi:hypothetical protein
MSNDEVKKEINLQKVKKKKKSWVNPGKFD